MDQVTTVFLYRDGDFFSKKRAFQKVKDMNESNAHVKMKSRSRALQRVAPVVFSFEADSYYDPARNLWTTP